MFCGFTIGYEGGKPFEPKLLKEGFAIRILFVYTPGKVYVYTYWICTLFPILGVLGILASLILDG